MHCHPDELRAGSAELERRVRNGFGRFANADVGPTTRSLSEDKDCFESLMMPVARLRDNDNDASYTPIERTQTLYARLALSINPQNLLTPAWPWLRYRPLTTRASTTRPLKLSLAAEKQLPPTLSTRVQISSFER